ncbi:MAG TPA: hypothetical protein PK691_01160 [Thermomicrobiales bacterium]|nr:hypothetical protein [Thermomicrobiales bacterium]
MLCSAAATGWSRIGVTFVILGLAVLVGSVAVRWATGIPLVIGFVALFAIGALLDADSGSYLPAALIGTALLLAAEFAAWAIEIPPGRIESGAFVQRRLVAIGRLGLFALILTGFATLIASINLAGSTLLTGIGAAGTLLILVLTIWWIRRVRF